jgi:hypothetical protein
MAKAFVSKKHKGGGLDVSVVCEFCGLPITRTSKEYGMDCANRCAEKKMKELCKKDPDMKIFSDFMAGKASLKKFEGVLKKWEKEKPHV